MRVLVSGASGLIGTAVVNRLLNGGHSVARLVRHAPSNSSDIPWDPKTLRFDLAAAEGCDAVVHLAGANVASGRWSAQRRAEIRDSRVAGTRFLSESLATLERPPKVLLSASAIGFYGSSGDIEQTESSRPGTGFLAEVCQGWEAARGGAFARMLPAFKLGLGGRVGDGQQWMSWITLDDAVRIVEWALGENELRGPVNVVSPQPVRQAEFAGALGRALHRPTLLPVPGFLLRALLGEMAEELLLASTRVAPRVLTDRSYRFEQPDLEGALRSLLISRS
jgi:uncharacterized protein